MPPAKNSTSRSSRPGTFREPAALKWLSSSLDAAQQALVELREDAGRDLSQGARDLHKDLRAFISSARRDTGKLAKALQRDFEHAQKQLAQGTGTADRQDDDRAGLATRSGGEAQARHGPARVHRPCRALTGTEDREREPAQSHARHAHGRLHGPRELRRA